MLTASAPCPMLNSEIPTHFKFAMLRWPSASFIDAHWFFFDAQKRDAFSCKSGSAVATEPARLSLVNLLVASITSPSVKRGDPAFKKNSV